MGRGTGEQCRQPRRGGTGGDGTIRRTRRRRLRWSSPPGQIEQMPHGERSPDPRRAAPEQGAYRALAEGLALPRLLASPLLSPAGSLPSLSPAYPAFSLLSCPLSPRPPSPAGKGETQSLFRRGLRPRHPGTELLAALAEPAKKMPSGGLAPALLALPPLSPAGELSPPRLACAPCRRRPRRGRGREVRQRRGWQAAKRENYPP